MKLNSILKVMLVAAVAACFSLNADAQFGGLLNKAKNKAKEVVKDAGKDAKNTAKETAKEAAKEKADEAVTKVTGKKKDNAPRVKADSNIREIVRTYYYWAELQDKANKNKDLEWLYSLDGYEASNCIQYMINHPEAETFDFEIRPAVEHFNPIGEASNALRYAGKPNFKINDNASLAKALAWDVEKAVNGDQQERNFFTVEGGAIRYLNLLDKKYSDKGAVAEQTELLKQLWDTMDADYKAAFPNCNPYYSQAECININKKGLAELKKEFEAKEAARKAEIEANSKTAKELTGSMNAEWNAKVFKLAKQRVPDCTKVIVYSNAWDVKRQGSTILRRCIYAWVVKPDGTATDYGFCEDYQGGGKYGSLRNYSIGMRHVFVK